MKYFIMYMLLCILAACTQRYGAKIPKEKDHWCVLTEARNIRCSRPSFSNTSGAMLALKDCSGDVDTIYNPTNIAACE